MGHNYEWSTEILVPCLRAAGLLSLETLLDREQLDCIVMKAFIVYRALLEWITSRTAHKLLEVIPYWGSLSFEVAPPEPGYKRMPYSRSPTVLLLRCYQRLNGISFFNYFISRQDQKVRLPKQHVSESHLSKFIKRLIKPPMQWPNRHHHFYEAGFDPSLQGGSDLVYATDWLIASRFQIPELLEHTENDPEKQIMHPLTPIFNQQCVWIKFYQQCLLARHLIYQWYKPLPLELLDACSDRRQVASSMEAFNYQNDKLEVHLKIWTQREHWGILY